MLRVGDRVKIRIPRGEATVAHNIRQFNGVETTVTAVDAMPKRIPHYHLDGCVSDAGKPYFFLEEWLIPLDESEV